MGCGGPSFWRIKPHVLSRGSCPLAQDKQTTNARWLVDLGQTAAGFCEPSRTTDFDPEPTVGRIPTGQRNCGQRDLASFIAPGRLEKEYQDGAKSNVGVTMIWAVLVLGLLLLAAGAYREYFAENEETQGEGSILTNGLFIAGVTLLACAGLYGMYRLLF